MAAPGYKPRHDRLSRIRTGGRRAGTRVRAALHARPDGELSPTSAGRRLIIAFYPADWSPVCTDQMALYNEILPEFGRSAPSSSASRSTRLVPHRVRARPATSTSRCSPTSIRRARSRSAYGVYDDAHRHERAGALRRRRRRRHPLELRLADRRQPGRRRHPHALESLAARAAADSVSAVLDRPRLTVRSASATTSSARRRRRSRWSSTGTTSARTAARRTRSLKQLLQMVGDETAVTRSATFRSTQIHPHAQLAAEAAEAAGAQGRFWEMHDLLFEHQRRTRHPAT